MNADGPSADRIRRALAGRNVVEKKMMGGLVFMVDGHMCCGLGRDGLMVRVGAAAHDQILALPHVEPMRIGERSLAGFVRIDPAGWRSDAALARWLQRGLDFVATLPPEHTPAKSGRKRR